MKKTLTGIVVGIYLMQFIGTASAQLVQSSFPDVPVGSKHYVAVEHFHTSGIIEGYSDGTFRPDQEATRAEALKIILLSSGKTINESDVGNIFPDVNSGDWFYEYVKAAKNLEIVVGYDDGNFKPHQTQNIAETLKMILLTNDVQISDVSDATLVFPDVNGELWFAPYALYAKDKNIIEPQGDGNLNAGRGVTRGELVELMYRMEMVNKQDGEPFDISTNWLDKSFPEQGFKTKMPFDWRVVYNEDQIVFWHPDTVNHQSSYEVPYPYSASITFHLDSNDDGLTGQQIKDNLEMVYKSDFGSYQKSSHTFGSYAVFNLTVSPVHDDYYMFVPNDDVLHMYTAYGWSDLTDHLKEQIDKILENVEYINPSSTGETDVLTTARNQILVEGLGQATLDLFSDLTNIETDTIGVGTGPIDYFYSAAYDITLKYERASDTVLDIQTGQTSAF
ncbi:S-layer homology domain-containing protein [Patescibacteria group bacterium]